MDLTPWAWLILPLGATRLLQIVLWDRVLRRPRSWLMGKLNPRGLPMHDPARPYFSYLLECPWCMSVWLGGGLVALVAWDASRQITLAVLLALTLSLAAVLLDRAIDASPLRDQPPEEPAPTMQGVMPPPEAPPAAVVDALHQLTGDDADEET